MHIDIALSFLFMLAPWILALTLDTRYTFGSQAVIAFIIGIRMLVLGNISLAIVAWSIFLAATVVLVLDIKNEIWG